ncbi:MAG: glycoside hydrolase family 99-like domain-containing protein, partial [Oscillospiraceae bacterium]
MKYMNYKKVISGVIVFIMMCGVFPKFAIAEENEFEYEDNQEQKYVIDENFPFMKNEILQEICKEKPSGWDIRSAGSKFESSRNRYFKVIDNNEFLPVEMIRKFEPLTHGLVTFDFGFKFEADMSESSWIIGSKENDAVKIIRDKGKLNFQLPDGSYADLGDCDVNETYGVRASVDIDNKKCDIYVNGKLKAKDLPFTTPTDYLSQVTIDTGKKAMGKIQLLYVRVHRGYIVNEQMLTGMKNIPEDWKVETDGGYAKGELKESSQKPDIYSMKIDSRGGDVKLTKDFEVQDNKLIYKYKILIPKAIDGVKISLASGADNAISVTTNGSEFVSIDGGGNEKNIYKYVPNVWYHFKWEIDLNTNLATININGRKAIEDVPIASNGSIDNIIVLAKQNSITEIFLDDFLLTKKYDEPSDYVPEPKKVESENTLNGMQMCSLWRDGNHIGWDWINNTPERKPYMGYYDEGSPEVADWEIKWMLEHGINFQMYCWYNIVADSDQPLKDPAMGWAIHDGLFDAKYRDQMDYMILWENAPHKAKNTLEHFKNNLVPFWIEHYLKDENYLKVDNRPIFGIYEYGQFLNDVGGKEKAKEALEYFTNECNKAGVGEPFFITSSSGNNDEVAVGFDY